MQTVIRQDGSAVELSDADAAVWIKRGLATAQPTAKPVAESAWGRKTTPEPVTFNEGE